MQGFCYIKACWKYTHVMEDSFHGYNLLALYTDNFTPAVLPIQERP